MNAVVNLLASRTTLLDITPSSFVFGFSQMCSSYLAAFSIAILRYSDVNTEIYLLLKSSLSLQEVELELLFKSDVSLSLYLSKLYYHGLCKTALCLLLMYIVVTPAVA